MRMRCQDSQRTTTQPSSSMASLEMSVAAVGMTYLQALSSSISSGAGFDTHYYQSLLNGRAFLPISNWWLMRRPRDWWGLMLQMTDQWWRCQALTFWLDLKFRSDGTAPCLWSVPKWKSATMNSFKCLFLSY